MGIRGAVVYHGGTKGNSDDLKSLKGPKVSNGACSIVVHFTARSFRQIFM